MNTRVFESFSDKETFDIAFRIANNLKAKTGSVVVCLDGDLGVGKTVFAKGFDYRKIAVEGIDDEDFGN